ncbi:hypothetical protein [Cellulomonas sp. NS3]|uniref:hypothetical protein n=1 Tax=Cellulomonas sp. NS3 TaxID=2973977 RepID=UPI0021630B70|nr:hypothetical protein [Cellulomonas sp. NS3]
MQDEYVLGTLPRGLRVRASAISTARGLLVLLGTGVGLVLASRARVDGSVVTVVLVVAAALVAVVLVGLQSMTPYDRQLLRDTRRRTLAPLDPTGRTPELTVALRPGPINRRRLRDAPPDLRSLTADLHGLRVPGWLIEGRPAGLRPADVVHVPWRAVRRWRVRADSEGPDVWVIDCAPTPGAPGTGTRARWRVRRPEITDEVAVLDFARAFGQVTVELEASVGGRGPAAGA